MVNVKQQHHKFLIGPAGVNIQKIRDETGARIIFPGVDDADKENIIIVGNNFNMVFCIIFPSI